MDDFKPTELTGIDWSSHADVDTTRPYTGVELVMGFCTDAEYEEFCRTVPVFEDMLVQSGTILIKLWFDVSDKEQEARFQARLGRSWKRW